MHAIGLKKVWNFSFILSHTKPTATQRQSPTKGPAATLGLSDNLKANPYYSRARGRRVGPMGPIHTLQTGPSLPPQTPQLGRAPLTSMMGELDWTWSLMHS